MQIFLTGGTGFIGAPLGEALAASHHRVTVASRSPQQATTGFAKNVQVVGWSDEGGKAWKNSLKDCECIINLAGEPIAAKRWSAEQKNKIRDSRLETTRMLVSALQQQNSRVKIFINASAVGYYGPRGDELITESAPAGEGFLAETCRLWEAEAQKSEALAERAIRLRIGVVLGPGGGALAKMIPPFKMFAGGPLGSGEQWMPWVHRADVIGLISFLLDHPRAAGPINATAPNPERMRDFCKALARALHRPSWAPVPAPILRIMLGEMADMLLTGQRVIPDAAQKLGYAFRFPTLEAALADCIA